MKTTMVKKMSKLVIVSALVASIALPGMAFADQTQVTPGAPAGEKVILNEKAAPNQKLTVKEKAPKIAIADKIALKIAEKRAAFEKKQQERQAQVEEKRLAYRTKITEVINLYAADLMGAFEAAWASHDSIHTDLMAERATIRNDQLTKNEAYLLDIHAQVEAGTMTKEAAKASIETFKAANAADREAIKQTIEALKSNSGVTPELRKELHEALTAAVTAKDPVAVKAALNAILEALTKHIQFDVEKLAYLKTL